MLFGALAAGATALLGRRLFGELAGLVAGLALAASSYFVSWSQAARGYTLCGAAGGGCDLRVRARLRGAFDYVVGDLGCLADGRRLGERVRVLGGRRAPRRVHALPSPAELQCVLAACAALAAFLPQLVLFVMGDNGQVDWIPTPTPRRVAVGIWTRPAEIRSRCLPGPSASCSSSERRYPGGALEGCARGRLARGTARCDAARVDLPAGFEARDGSSGCPAWRSPSAPRASRSRAGGRLRSPSPLRSR